MKVFTFMHKRILLILSGLGMFLLATGLSYTVFIQRPDLLGIKSVTNKPPVKKDGQLVFDTALPLTQSCPLNGEKYSTQQESWWKQHEPLGVMVENHEEARPQSGLSAADVIYEAVAEGGITRFLAIYYCQDTPQIGPIRSARIYFLDFLSEYGSNPLYVHVGGANTDGPADALQILDDWGWSGYNDINQFSVGFPTFWRDYERLPDVATEHTMYSSPQKLWDFAKEKRGISQIVKDHPWNEDFITYSFQADTVAAKRPESQKVDLVFWSGTSDYRVSWIYDPKTNRYLRSNGGEAQLDLNTKKQLAVKNVVVLVMNESTADDGYENNQHLLYDTIGKGKAIVFQNGKRISATWQKESRTDRTILLDGNGKQIDFIRGQIWFEIIPSTGSITVK